MNEIEILKKYYESLKKSNDFDYKNSLLFSAYSVLLLSTNLFKLNIDLKEVLTPLLKSIDKVYPPHKKPLVFLDYVYKSRSQVIARFIRIIQKDNEPSQKILIENLKQFVEKENQVKNQKTINQKLNENSPKSKKRKRKNSVDELLERFGRN